jgi:hypothetical protein
MMTEFLGLGVNFQLLTQNGFCLGVKNKKIMMYIRTYTYVSALTSGFGKVVLHTTQEQKIQGSNPARSVGRC